jgi:hypothetical protein
LKDSTEQGPVDGPRLDGFGFVGAVAVDAFLADVELPASEIDWCGFHGVGVWLVRSTVRNFRRVGQFIG